MGYVDQELPQQVLAASRRRGFWLRQVHRWHWISSGLCLAGMLLFSITGITLNHAGDIAGKPVTQKTELTIAGAQLEALQKPVPENAKRPLPASARDWFEKQLDISIKDATAEWSEFEVFVPMPRPGGDATLTIDRETGKATYETTDHGWISFFNDLHKGRHTGVAWSWFIDIFAGACLVFTVTGLVLLQLHARTRPSTWPIVAFSLLLPVVFVLLLVHR